jgi:hypothetical protein
LFCQSCPEEVRNALLSLQRIESSRDGSTTMKALVYGSGKLFFRRIWSRLHSDKIAVVRDKGTLTGRNDVKTEGSTAEHATAQSHEHDAEDSSSTDTEEGEQFDEVDKSEEAQAEQVASTVKRSRHVGSSDRAKRKRGSDQS